MQLVPKCLHFVDIQFSLFLVTAEETHRFICLFYLVIFKKIFGAVGVEVPISQIKQPCLLCELRSIGRITHTLVELCLVDVEFEDGWGVLDCLVY